NCSPESIRKMLIVDKNRYNEKLITENLVKENAIENTVRNSYTFDHLQTNNSDRDFKEIQDYSKSSPDLLKRNEKIGNTPPNSLTNDSSVEFRTINCNNEANCTQLWIYLDGIHDPMNLGAILRSSYFLGIDKVLVSHKN
ncbi:unnamed protein product, partial [Meganyctiphanes norvegica]